MTHWLNDTSRELNGKIYKRRQRSLTPTQRWKLHEIFVEFKLDRKMSFPVFLKNNRHQLRQIIKEYDATK